MTNIYIFLFILIFNWIQGEQLKSISCSYSSRSYWFERVWRQSRKSLKLDLVTLAKIPAAKYQ